MVIDLDPRRLRLLRVLQCRSVGIVKYWDYENGRRQLKIRRVRCERPLHFRGDHR